MVRDRRCPNELYAGVIEDTHAILKVHGNWMPLSKADKGKPTKPGALEDWARFESNPVAEAASPMNGWFKGNVARCEEILTALPESAVNAEVGAAPCTDLN